jgi:hypothetical protein
VKIEACPRRAVVDHETLTDRYAGRNCRLADMHRQVIHAIVA